MLCKMVLSVIMPESHYGTDNLILSISRKDNIKIVFWDKHQSLVKYVKCRLTQPFKSSVQDIEPG